MHASTFASIKVDAVRFSGLFVVSYVPLFVPYRVIHATANMIHHHIDLMVYRTHIISCYINIFIRCFFTKILFYNISIQMMKRMTSQFEDKNYLQFSRKRKFVQQKVCLHICLHATNIFIREKKWNIFIT